MTFAEWLDRLQAPAGGVEFSRQLLDIAPPAFAFECPPLTGNDLDQPFEYATPASPALSRVRPDPQPFRDIFANQSTAATVATFHNLGGDALLVAPLPPADPGVDCAHLGIFLRTAPDGLVDEFWSATARAALDHLSDAPLWLGTAGLGVYWLHMRLDSRPKYYRTHRYCNPGFWNEAH